MDPSKPTIDENGFLHYAWPPFPNPPAGAKIVKFKDFKSHGIQLSMMDEGVELDGEGVPTVQLNVKHELEPKPKKKNKAKKKLDGQEAPKRTAWWEEWAAGEDLRNHSYDDALPPSDRLALADADFKKHRSWPPFPSRVHEWYERLRVFIGLAAHQIKPMFKKQIQEDEDLVDVDSEEEDISSSKPSYSQKAEGSSMFVETDEEWQLRVQRQAERTQRRMDAFLSDPDESMRIFFSSHFRDTGMMWSTVALRDCPTVALFFLKFLERNHVLPELERALRSAIKITERAQVELPRTKQIGAVLPDNLSYCFASLFGNHLRKIVWPPRDEPMNEPNLKKTKLDDIKEEGSDDAHSFEDALQESGAELIPEEINPSSVPIPDAELQSGDDTLDTGSGWGKYMSSEWNGEEASANKVDMPDQDKLAPLEDDMTASDAQEEHNPWAEAETSQGWEVTIHSLMPFAGPTSLPLTHKVGYVEESTRCISGLTMPDAAIEGKPSGDWLSQFAKVVLVPYTEFAATDRATIVKPDILEDPFEKKNSNELDHSTEGDLDIPRHDPLKDHITLLVEAKSAETLVKGMGIGGTFVQIIPDNSATHTGDNSGSTVRKAHTHGGKHANKKSKTDVYWYAEQVSHIIPSFWTDSQIQLTD